MKHLHYTSLESTQDQMVNEFDKFLDEDYLLVSADEQTKGRGRHGRTWEATGDALFISLKLPPANTLTLTTLELSVLLCDYFKQELQVKWPNDIYTFDQKKCAGILIDVKEGKLIAGIGINLRNDGSGAHSYGAINVKDPIEKREHCYQIAKFIQESRLSDNEIIQRWNKLCFHLKKNVEIIDQGQSFFGLFEGIGRNGQALLNIEGSVKECYSGSLKFIS